MSRRLWTVQRPTKIQHAGTTERVSAPKRSKQADHAETATSGTCEKARNVTKEARAANGRDSSAGKAVPTTKTPASAECSWVTCKVGMASGSPSPSFSLFQKVQTIPRRSTLFVPCDPQTEESRLHCGADSSRYFFVATGLFGPCCVWPIGYRWASRCVVNVSFGQP